MYIKIISASHPNHVTPRQDFDIFGGHAAGVCYMQNTFDELCQEPIEKTMRRVKLTKESGHHSVYDHMNITLYMENIPRVIEVLLDNERMMTSSVKSGRYTRHALNDDEKTYYDKWYLIFKDLITAEYQKKFPAFFTDGKIDKLAMENARYVTGCFTLITMLHTFSYRQLNYVYGFIRDFVAKETTNDFILRLKPYLTELLAEFEKTGYIDQALTNNGKNRTLSLFNNYKPVEYFGDVYATTYRGSFAHFLHANRHRTLKYHIAEPKIGDWYTPEILQGTKYAGEWVADLEKLKNNYPQAMILDITEFGNLDDFVLKAIERKCSVVMLETTRAVNDILTRYHKALVASKHPRAGVLGVMTKGAKCTFPDFKCPAPCGFADAVNEKRKI